MILDTSAAVAMFRGESEAETFAGRISDADVVRMSVANWFELMMVLSGQYARDAADEAEAFVTHLGVIVEPVSLEQGRIARQAFLDFGKGRHPAGLNFGDCFAYALAKAVGEPLLFKGEDFSRTDIQSA